MLAENDRRRRWDLLALAVALLSLLPAAALFAALLRSPWDVEIGEGLIEWPARQGGGLEAIYPPWDAAPLPYAGNYSPLPAMLGGALRRATGADALAAMRALSLGGAVLAALGIFRLARLLGASGPAAAAAGLLLLGLHPMAALLGLARTDGPAVGFALLGASFVAGNPRARTAAIGLVLVSLAAACHQRFLVVFPAAALLWILGLPPERRRTWNAALPPLAGLAALGLFLAAVLSRTQGRAWFYMVTLPGAVPLSAAFAVRVFVESAVLWGLVWAAAGAVAARLDRPLRLPLLLAVLPFLGNFYFCLNIGSSRNYFLPVTAAALPYLAAGLSRPGIPAALVHGCRAVVLVAALGHAAWTGLFQAPQRLAQAERYRAAAAALAEVDGPVFSSNMFAHLSRIGPRVLQTNWAWWLTRRCAPELWERDSRWLRAAVREGRFAAVLVPVDVLFPLDEGEFAVRYRRAPPDHPLSKAYGRVYLRND